MIKLNDVMTENQKIVLTVFNPQKIIDTQKELDSFNEKTSKFLKVVEKLKIEFNF